MVPNDHLWGGGCLFRKTIFRVFSALLNIFFLHLDIDTFNDLFCEEKFRCLKRLFQILGRNSEIPKTKAEKTRLVYGHRIHIPIQKRHEESAVVKITAPFRTQGIRVV